MALAQQHTIAADVAFAGIGLHGGVMATVTLRPGAPDQGIVFRRVDLGEGAPTIPARFDRVVDTRYRTTLGVAGATVATVEHLMAAFAGAALDNAIVDIAGPEVPILDGSAGSFLRLIDGAGLRPQNAPRRALRVRKSMVVERGTARAALEPGDGLVVDLAIDHPGTPVGRQHDTVTVTGEAFRAAIAPARTYGFLDQVGDLHAAGLGRGGSLANTVVVDGQGVLNPGGLRHANEFVRHKIADAIGDLYLAGGPILGRFVGEASGHGLNNALLRALFADPDAWRHEVMTGDSL